MDTIKRALLNWWVVTITIAVLCVVLFVVALPIFVPFLRPWWVRLLILAFIAAVWGTFAILRFLKAKAASDAIARELAAAQPGSGEADEISRRMGEALASLRGRSSKKQDYLYSQPWYVIIGPPGAGKTTALLNSGLRFPFSDQAFKGVGGTRNLDVWFAEEAVLIDTAGRYTSQDSHAQADASAWSHFLGLLKRHRPLQPVNGILVAFPLDDIIRADQAAIDRHAATVRRRLAEVRQALEIAMPVYVLFTKADLLAGFAEYFEDLDAEGRRAVLGNTLAHADGQPSADAIARAFDQMSNAVSARQAQRLNDEPDARRRSLLLAFPAQIDGLRARIVRFLEGAVAGNDEAAGRLRGFYLTSGVQQGAPIDRLLAGMAEAGDQPQGAAAAGGRAYFLNRLLGEVVFPEAGLVQANPQARARRRTQMLGIFAGIGGLCALIFCLWVVSFIGNIGLQHALNTQAAAASDTLKDSGVDLVEVGPNDADLSHAAAALDALRALPHGYADRKKGGAPLFLGFGLFQDGLSKRAELEYREGLRRILLPRLLLRLETYMTANMGDPIKVYEPLKAYLMLGGQKPGAIDAKAVAAWTEADWEREVFPGADNGDLRKHLAEHLDALLEDKDMARVWPDGAPPLDQGLIDHARAAISTLSMADRAYAVLAQKALAASEAPWQASSVLASGDGAAFANGADVLALKVPYFFTRAGYEKLYIPGLVTVRADLEKDLWVFGKDADTASIKAQMGEIRSGVTAHYVQDYAAAWDQVVTTPKPADYFADDAAFNAFARPLSPLKLLLTELRKNTRFDGVNKAAAGIVGALGDKAKLLDDRTGPDAGQAIQAHFAEIQDYVGDGKAPAPIDDFVTALKAARQATLAAKSLQGGAGSDAAQAQMAQANAALNAVAPPALQGFVAGAAKGGATAQTSAAEGAISQTYVSLVLPDCKQATTDKYPFYRDSKVDLAVVDTLRTFGPGGTMDGFVSQRVKPLLDTSGPVWRWQQDNAIAATFNPASAEEMSRAAQLRDILVGGLALKVAAASLGPDVDAVEISAGGTTYRFDAQSTAAKPLMWTMQGLPEAHVTLLKGGQTVASFAAEGPWALFRVMDAAAARQNAGTTAFLATFGQGTKSAVMRVDLPSSINPFSRGGLWTFRCPVTL